MKVLILGAGQIGSAAAQILRGIGWPIELWDKTTGTDVSVMTSGELGTKILRSEVSHVLNALPFHLNAHVARAAVSAGASYVDFTEDDQAASEVQAIYAKHPGLSCAVKCGLAPGFINYVGLDLIGKIEQPQELMVAVGALPRDVNFASPAGSYNLSWSVDGLVNEYVRPCQVRRHGRIVTIPPLTGVETVIADGVTYEAAFTSGGIGSLVHSNVPDVAYKTLRYPGHWQYVREAVTRLRGDFEALRAEFSKVFPFNPNGIVQVYAEAIGTTDGRAVRHTFSRRFVGGDGLSAIQATTAGAGVAILELLHAGKIGGMVNATEVPLDAFYQTRGYWAGYQE